MTGPLTVLVLCTGNSARSILAECLLDRLGAGRIAAHSAGSHPRGAVHPLALELLHAQGFATDRLRSKSWDEFARPGAPALDLVVTVCDSAAAESCPVWPGHPLTVHWGIPDPAAVDGPIEVRRQAFRDAFGALEARIRRLAVLPIEAMDRGGLKQALDAIGAPGESAA